MYKILTADDHPIFREAIIHVIKGKFPDSTILETSTFDETQSVVAQHDDIDLVLLDLNMPGMEGYSGLIELREKAPTTPVVIVSAEEDKNIVLQAMTYGAVGFITKSSSREEMHEALEQILEGNIYLPSNVIRGDAPSAPSRRQKSEQIDPALLNTLTRRQLIVLQRMASGESNKQIAYSLSIAETTVKAHVSAILRKLKVTNRIQAAIAARDINFSDYLKR